MFLETVVIPLFHTLMVMVAIKAIMGFRFSWEPIPRAKRKLYKNLENLEALRMQGVPEGTIDRMKMTIESI